MDDLISRLEIIPLSGEDLVMMSHKLGNQNVKFILYENLRGMTLDSLFAEANSVFILFEIKSAMGIDPVGHWAVLIRRPGGDISYYDPYGLVMHQDVELSGEGRWLEQVVGGTKVDENTDRHQEFRDAVQTCGRHVVSRSLFHFMDNQQYNSLVIKELQPFVESPDTYVSLLTGFLARSDDIVQSFFMTRV